jgi:hypothetical protein
VEVQARYWKHGRSTTRFALIFSENAESNSKNYLGAKQMASKAFMVHSQMQ